MNKNWIKLSIAGSLGVLFLCSPVDVYSQMNKVGNEYPKESTENVTQPIEEKYNGYFSNSNITLRLYPLEGLEGNFKCELSINSDEYDADGLLNNNQQINGIARENFGDDGKSFLIRLSENEKDIEIEWDKKWYRLARQNDLQLNGWYEGVNSKMVLQMHQIENGDYRGVVNFDNTKMYSSKNIMAKYLGGRIKGEYYTSENRTDFTIEDKDGVLYFKDENRNYQFKMTEATKHYQLALEAQKKGDWETVRDEISKVQRIDIQAGTRYHLDQVEELKRTVETELSKKDDVDKMLSRIDTLIKRAEKDSKKKTWEEIVALAQKVKTRDPMTEEYCYKTEKYAEAKMRSSEVDNELSRKEAWDEVGKPKPDWEKVNRLAKKILNYDPDHIEAEKLMWMARKRIQPRAWLIWFRHAFNETFGIKNSEDIKYEEYMEKAEDLAQKAKTKFDWMNVKNEALNAMYIHCNERALAVFNQAQNELLKLVAEEQKEDESK